jgi:DNA-binding transcriptional MocR family regulator
LFSTILYSSLRLGYVIISDDSVDAFRKARVLIDRHSPNADQHVLAAFMAEGHLERHVRTDRPKLILGFGGLSNARVKAAAQRLATVIGQ